MDGGKKERDAMAPQAAALLQRCMMALMTSLLLGGCAVNPGAVTQMVARPRGQIETMVEGAGPTVLMIASLGRPAADFNDLSARLVQAGYRTVRFNASGIGRSTGPMKGVSLVDLAVDAAAVVQATGDGPVAVIGHAFGQRVARMLATERPELVSRVVMLAAGGKAPMLPGAREALLDCFKPELSPEQHLNAVRLAFFAPGNDPSVWRDGWYADVATMQAAANQAVPVERWWGAGSARLLVVQGLQDTVAPPQNGRLIKQEFATRAELVEIDGAGHGLLPEQPEQLTQAVLAFLKRP
jgi:pimeloyl-ACP methyl ester carboxylesterase